MAEGALAGAEHLRNGRNTDVPDALRARFPPGSLILEHDSISLPEFSLRMATGNAAVPC
jgi:hypothetical protein